MSLDQITQEITARLGKAAGLDKAVKFDFGDDGIIHVDNTQTPPVITHEDNEADVTLACSIDTFEAILNGRKDPNVAFMMGQLKVRGSMGLAMKLNSILED
jgi:putative sterol carrier protein